MSKAFELIFSFMDGGRLSFSTGIGSVFFGYLD